MPRPSAKASADPVPRPGPLMRWGLVGLLLLMLVTAAWWHGRVTGPGDAAATAATELSADEARQLEAFLDEYFDSWSRQDMGAYQACFHPRATIHNVDAEGRVTMQRLDDFIAGQRAGHLRSVDRMIEVPLWHRVEPGLKAVQVHVRWKLTAGPREVLGRNHYTLLRGGEAGFQILNLVFYGEYGEETTATED